MRISCYCVEVVADSEHAGKLRSLGMPAGPREFHVFKGMARQSCQAVATTGKQADLLEVSVESEPRDILAAALEGELDELAEVVLLEEYVPTHELKLAPGSWGYRCVPSEEEG